jgi:hypothetical protein
MPKYPLPVQGDYKNFCEFMNYDLLYVKNEFYYYHIPQGHICRFKINCENWLKGNFDKNKFLESLKSN